MMCALSATSWALFIALFWSYPNARAIAGENVSCLLYYNIKGGVGFTLTFL